MRGKVLKTQTVVYHRCPGCMKPLYVGDQFSKKNCTCFPREESKVINAFCRHNYVKVKSVVSLSVYDTKIFVFIFWRGVCKI